MMSVPPHECVVHKFSFFSRSCLLYAAAGVRFRLDGAIGLKTLTSKNVFSYLPPQTPFADRSSLAPSCVLADAPSSWLGETGCKSGSTRTSLHTSVSNEAVMSLISLCLIVGNPPLAQDSAWSTVKAWPHSHFVCNFDGVQPYLNARASWKADLCRVNP